MDEDEQQIRRRIEYMMTKPNAKGDLIFRLGMVTWILGNPLRGKTEIEASFKLEQTLIIECLSAHFND